MQIDLAEVGEHFADLLHERDTVALQPDAAVLDPDRRRPQRFAFAGPLDAQAVLEAETGAVPLALQEVAAGVEECPGREVEA